MAKKPLLCAAIAAATLGASLPAGADELVYTPINPSFGGNPFNSSHLLGIANAQNDYKSPESRDAAADQFVRMLQSRLLSALATRVSEAILGDDAQPTGEIVYGAQTVTWETLLDSIRLTITDADTGSVTEIVIPTLGPTG